MEALEAILTRRSTRRYSGEMPERALIEKVIEADMRLAVETTRLPILLFFQMREFSLTWQSLSVMSLQKWKSLRACISP